jgi:protein-S-isoprenylcysteine O-methyltransferase Ste14
MFPILVFMYVRLARREEREAIEHCGDAYRRYMTEVPVILPRPGRIGRAA